VTATVADPDTASSPEAPGEIEETAAGASAPWWARAAALLVDVLPGAAVVVTMAFAALTVPLGGVWWWSCVALGGLGVLLTGANRWLLPAGTGWSLGRAALGIAVVRRDKTPAGPLRLLLRDLAHVVDTLSVFVGWVWPLWDQRGRTFADMLVRTEVQRSKPRRTPRETPTLVAVVFLIAALLCVLGATVSNLVYRDDQATDRTRAQISSQGPKIVAQMLSYHPDSLQADFEHAQSLVTGNYREKLVTEQHAVQKGKPVTNEYWVPNSSVLSASPHRATMLLFLQGLRGDAKKQRPISATVRVAFAGSADEWRVDDLTVLTKPLPGEEGN
jgi:Mce-associated membrane protein